MVKTTQIKKGGYIVSGYSAVGKKEHEGPLGKFFHKWFEDDYLGEKSHEAAERKLLKTAFDGAVRAAKLKFGDIDAILSGDLLNQIISASFASRGASSAFLGVYGACSTMALGLGLGATMTQLGAFKRVLVGVSSHFATAERQYRLPLEQGSQRVPVAQWTITGAGATVVSSDKPTEETGAKKSFCPRIVSATFGRIVDPGIKDANNMGGAMAPSAADTLTQFFRNTKTAPKDFDAIFTGDLGRLGEEIMRDLCAREGFTLGAEYSDCGWLVYDSGDAVQMGGSGAGCSAIVFNSYILKKLRSGEFRRILFIATGALLSATTALQGESIPCVAHLVEIRS
ncbi:MAG: stage V sporulation protein AD [Christensenellaceae bacterium]|jgi:stage V sporulation protein AD|nr:stage V sporulation protein AD [Christensenellaceae bacterium]